MTKTTYVDTAYKRHVLWFAQNSLPLRWQRQQIEIIIHWPMSCDLLKIHYLCGDKDNQRLWRDGQWELWFAQNSLPLRWQRQPGNSITVERYSCDLLKIHYLCGDKDNLYPQHTMHRKLWFAQNSLPLRWQRQPAHWWGSNASGCDLLKIHYLCGDKDNYSLMQTIT